MEVKRLALGPNGHCPHPGRRATDGAAAIETVSVGEQNKDCRAFRPERALRLRPGRLGHADLARALTGCADDGRPTDRAVALDADAPVKRQSRQELLQADRFQLVRCDAVVGDLRPTEKILILLCCVGSDLFIAPVGRKDPTAGGILNICQQPSRKLQPRRQGGEVPEGKPPVSCRASLECRGGPIRHMAFFLIGDRVAQLALQRGDAGGKPASLVSFGLRFDCGDSERFGRDEHRREVDPLKDDEAAATALDHATPAARGAIDHESVSLQTSDMVADGSRVATALLREVLHPRR